MDTTNNNDCQTRFGFTPALVGTVQKDGANKFNLIKNSAVTSIKDIANSFRSILGQPNFPDTSFLAR